MSNKYHRTWLFHGTSTTIACSFMHVLEKRHNFKNVQPWLTRRERFILKSEIWRLLAWDCTYKWTGNEWRLNFGSVLLSNSEVRKNKLTKWKKIFEKQSERTSVILLTLTSKRKTVIVRRLNSYCLNHSLFFGFFFSKLYMSTPIEKPWF